MRRRRRTRQKLIRGRGISYMFKYRVYFGRKQQKGSGVLFTFLAKALQQAGNVIGI